MAARLHFSGDMNEINDWIDSLVACNISQERFQADDVKNANILFKKIGMNDKKIKCFWDRFVGITFVEWHDKIQIHLQNPINIESAWIGSSSN